MSFHIISQTAQPSAKASTGCGYSACSIQGGRAIGMSALFMEAHKHVLTTNKGWKFWGVAVK